MRRRPLLLGLLALLGSMLIAGAALPAGAGGSKPPTVPEPIQVPAGQKVVLDVTGKGVQIYDCKPSAANPAVNAWTFREPAAVLSGHRGRPVGIHFVGPTFESFDGSAVVGARPKSVQPDPTAIPWLLLEADANRGDGVLSQVGYIQRIETRGGVAPAEACDPGEDATLAVPYRARYVFYAD
jgi:Protein of unknown function (DUF3455)